MPVKFFGFLVVVSIFACLLGALFIIPSLYIVLRPKFLEPKENNENSKTNTNKIKSKEVIMKTLTSFIVLSMIFAVGSNLNAQETLTAKQIAVKSIEATRLAGAEAVATMTIIDSKGRERVRKIAQVTKLSDNGDTEKN